jgi:hypothetical protein
VPRRLFIAILAALAVLTLPGCTSKPDAALAPASAPAAATSPESVSAMSIDQKRSLVATNFQIEVPVPMGKVVRGESQGDSAWDYEIIVPAPTVAVAEWYKTEFEGRDWQFGEPTLPEPGMLVLTMTKNRAQSRVTIRPEADGSTRVQAVVGIGIPVLQTQ